GNLWLAATWTGLAWLAYGLLVRNDVASRSRQVLHFLGLAFGVVIALVGVQRGVEIVLRNLLGALGYFQATGSAETEDFAATDRFSFIAPLAVGVVVVASYLLWLASDSRRGGPVEMTVLRQTTLAVTAALMAFFFWYGCAELLAHLIERFGPSGTQP